MALNIGMKYDATMVPAGSDESQMYIAYFDGSQWQALTSTVDVGAKAVVARVEHFTQFALFASVAAAPAPIPTPTITGGQGLLLASSTA
jgi:hypothetical protein